MPAVLPEREDDLQEHLDVLGLHDALVDEGDAHQGLDLRLRDHDLPLGQEQNQVPVRRDLLEDAAVLDGVAVTDPASF